MLQKNNKADTVACILSSRDVSSSHATWKAMTVMAIWKASKNDALGQQQKSKRKKMML